MACNLCIENFAEIPALAQGIICQTPGCQHGSIGQHPTRQQQQGLNSFFDLMLLINHFLIFLMVSCCDFILMRFSDNRHCDFQS